MSARVLLVCVAACALAFASLADEPKEVKETKLKPTAIYSGSHSQIRQERFELITTKDAWDKLWEQHRGARKDRRFSEESLELSLDFDSQYVVAVFTGWCGWCVITPRQRGDAVVIGYEATLWQTEGRLPKQTTEEKAREDALAPYGFIVLPKPVKTVIIERGKRRDLMTPPDWTEQKRFLAPKDKK